MERYDSYKDSGIEWIGEIPSHWTSRKLRAVVNPLRPITYGIVQAGEKLQQGVPYIRPVDMDDGYIPDCDALPKTSIEIASKYVRSELIEGDLVCSIGPSFGKLGFARSVHVGANLTQGTARVSAGKKVQPGFLFHVLGSSGVNQFWGSVATGATFPALNLKPLGETPVPVPPLHEQEQIVEYLDRKTTLIDSLIEKTVRKIELLKEKRTSLINEVVTKGLNPDVEMKDSGVEWIGKIPSHWIVRRNKYITSQRKDKSETGKEELLSVSEYQGVVPRRVIRDGEEHLSRSESFEGYLMVSPGELVSNIMLMWKTGLGVSEYEGLVSPAYSVFRFTHGSPKYFHYLFRTSQYTSEYRRNSKGVIESRLRLYDDSFGRLSSHFPPLHEQEQIVEYLDEQTSIIDSTITTEEKRIDLLKEYRQSLISEVVTGKVKVTRDE